MHLYDRDCERELYSEENAIGLAMVQKRFQIETLTDISSRFVYIKKRG
jgi:hypothetical protein